MRNCDMFDVRPWSSAHTWRAGLSAPRVPALSHDLTQCGAAKAERKTTRR